MGKIGKWSDQKYMARIYSLPTTGYDAMQLNHEISKNI